MHTDSGIVGLGEAVAGCLRGVRREKST